MWDAPGDTWRLDGCYGQLVIVGDADESEAIITAHEGSRTDLPASSTADAMAATMAKAPGVVDMVRW